MLDNSALQDQLSHHKEIILRAVSNKKENKLMSVVWKHIFSQW
jgi:hypothetical protein